MTIVDKTRQALFDLLESSLHRNGVELTPEGIREAIDSYRDLLSVSPSEAETVARTFEAKHGVTMSFGATLQDDFEPWLESRKATIDPYYWNRYESFLRHNPVLSIRVLAAMDQVTDRILSLLENPEKSDGWDRRGLVVGHVQSGKTANYTGLICKAADAGYRVIIVIAGIHNSLRNQTQIRLDEGFVGCKSGGEKARVGVGLTDFSRIPSTFTSSIKDFNTATANSVQIRLQDMREPTLFVVKKNASTLKSLTDWLRNHSAQLGRGRISEPLLLIDDEADNASINIAANKGEDVSRINGQIRELLQLFQRSSYVGYTATPFANIFIDPSSEDDMVGDDLFPRSFIVSLDPPSNYFGPRRVFQNNEDSVVRTIDDNEDLLPLKHKNHFHLVALPPSLVTALRTFIVARAIRILRGDGRAHASMLVNASRFIGVQHQICSELQLQLKDILHSVRVHAALDCEQALRDPEIAALKAVWKQEYPDAGVAWSEIQAVLLDVVAPISVQQINSKASGRLDYAEHRDGLSVVAVGGLSLSRGLTLEGLIVSYFLRNSVMYDTLLQMGRWFGYRDRYEDLCRVWMPEAAEGWYAHIAESVEELRDDLRYMEASGGTPRDFGLRVRSHPDTLTVTARNKSGSSERITHRVGLANRFVETTLLDRTPVTIEANHNTARSFADTLAEMGHALADGERLNSGVLVRNVPAMPVLQFLSAYQNHPASILSATDPICSYIQSRIRHGELERWDIYIPSVATSDALVSDLLGIEIRCPRRSPADNSDAVTFHARKRRIASRGIEKTGLDEDVATQVEAAHAALGFGPNFPDRIYRKVRTKPLLAVHLINVDDKRYPLSEPLVAWSISFPETRHRQATVEYVVNTTWLDEHFGGLDEESEHED